MPRSPVSHCFWSLLQQVVIEENICAKSFGLLRAGIRYYKSSRSFSFFHSNTKTSNVIYPRKGILIFLSSYLVILRALLLDRKEEYFWNISTSLNYWSCIRKLNSFCDPPDDYNFLDSALFSLKLCHFQFHKLLKI